MLAAVARAHGELHLLVNNAGGSWRGGFAETGWENVERHMKLNFEAPVRLTEELLPLLRATAAKRAAPTPRDRQRLEHVRSRRPPARRRVLREQVRARRLERLARGRGERARRPRRPRAPGVRRDRGVPGDRASPPPGAAVDRLQARQGRRGDRRVRACAARPSGTCPATTGWRRRRASSSPVWSGARRRAGRSRPRPPKTRGTKLQTCS